MFMKIEESIRSSDHISITTLVQDVCLFQPLPPKELSDDALVTEDIGTKSLTDFIDTRIHKSEVPCLQPRQKKYWIKKGCFCNCCVHNNTDNENCNMYFLNRNWRYTIP